MPKDLVMITMRHHRPADAKEQRDTTASVALAEALSGRFSPRKEGDGIWTGGHDTILSRYSLTGNDVRMAGEKLVQARPEIEKVFTAP